MRLQDESKGAHRQRALTAELTWAGDQAEGGALEAGEARLRERLAELDEA